MLLNQRNEIDRSIAQLIGRPASPGHLGEYIAAEVFNIRLESSAAAKGLDGTFVDGPLAGRTVNVKWMTVRQGGLDIAEANGPDYYLVLTGPQEPAGSSRGALRPFSLDAVFLFDSAALLEEQRQRGVQVGIFSSVRAAQWSAAMLYPEAKNVVLPLSPAQERLLQMLRL